ncbi:MAG: CRTAC1 family protein [Acidimicrobiia bacterium]
MKVRVVVGLLLLIVACTGDGETGGTEGPGGSDPGSTEATIGGTPATAGEAGDMTCWTAPPGGGEATISFSDQTEAMGLVAPLVGMYGHAAVWGDFTGDHRPDLFVGTFADRDPSIYQVRGADGAAPDRLLLSSEGGFSLDDRLEDMFARTSGGAVADLDNDGDLDLVVSRNFDDDMPAAPGVQVLRNDDGALTATTESGLPVQLGGRSIGVLDFDLDGMLDLFVTSDDGGSVLLRNEGGLVFADATAAAGLPADIFGLGVATGDVSGDGLQDIFVAGSNRLFVSNGPGSFAAADSSVFTWQFFGEEDLISGASIADVNRDGLLDIAVGHHFNSTVDEGASVPVRLYLNRGDSEFEDVTDAAGLVGLPTKGPHVELNDMDNDGWPDLVTTASAADGTRPAIFHHQGLNGDVPTFSTPDGLGSPQYWVAGPSADVDRDGRLDLFLVEFDPSLPSLLMRNETSSGHWLDVAVGPEHGFGIGWRVEVREPGGALIGAREITVTQGYSAGVAPVAHFGLGDLQEVDLRLVPTGGAEPIDLPAIAADQHLRYPAGCP